MVSTRVKAQLDEALRLCQAGTLPEAEQICRDILAHCADAGDAWNLLAMILHHRGELDEAELAAQRAIALQPDNPQYLMIRGGIAQAKRCPREAQSCYQRAIDVAPAFAEAHFRLAISYDREQRVADAITSYRNALRHAPDVALIHYYLAEALMLEARWVEAMDSYEAAFRRDNHGEFDRRGSIDCLTHLQFDVIPDFWVTEIARFFARDDIDKLRYASVVLRVLTTREAFRRLLSSPLSPGAIAEFDAAALDDVMRNEHFRIVLRDALVVDAGLESLVTRLRTGFLFDTALRAHAPADFLCALALQCFNNEFVFAESRDESVRVEVLLREAEAELNRNVDLADAGLRSLAVLAMYRPLHTVGGADRLAARTPRPAVLDKMLQRSVLDVLAERALRQDITVIGPISDNVSNAVRGMYEEHPYPRWFAFDRAPPLEFAEWLARQVSLERAPAEFPAAPRILCAGCGTGMEAIWLASDIVGAQVLGVDLSLSSLAFARRQARDLNVTNVEFRQGNILELGVLTERFDLIFCSGVLHHMLDPAAGLRVLLKLLRADGLLKIGLYSEKARVNVNAAREIIREQRVPATAAAIREFRQQVFASPADSPVRPLLKFRDFYAMSTCRDLLFHVQEHQFSLPKIESLLHEHGLEILGLSDVSTDAINAYRQMFSASDGMKNLKDWDAFEAAHPETFVAMYQVWCRLPRRMAP